MAHWTDRLDSFLGRLFFRAIGSLCAIVALIAAYAIWWHFTHWNPEYSPFVVAMFALVVIVGVSVVPYCFSRKRSFGEALDAMEGGTGGTRRP